MIQIFNQGIKNYQETRNQSELYDCQHEFRSRLFTHSSVIIISSLISGFYISLNAQQLVLVLS